MNPWNWSTVVLFPTFWQRLVLLFKWKPEIMFCWGDDQYTIRGVNGWEYLSIGGVPTDIQEELGMFPEPDPQEMEQFHEGIIRAAEAREQLPPVNFEKIIRLDTKNTDSK